MHKIGDGSYLAGMTLLGLSLTEIQTVLQLVALVLGSVATIVSIVVNIRRSIKDMNKEE